MPGGSNISTPLKTQHSPMRWLHLEMHQPPLLARIYPSPPSSSHRLFGTEDFDIASPQIASVLRQRQLNVHWAGQHDERLAGQPPVAPHHEDVHRVASLHAHVIGPPTASISEPRSDGAAAVRREQRSPATREPWRCVASPARACAWGHAPDVDPFPPPRQPFVRLDHCGETPVSAVLRHVAAVARPGRLPGTCADHPR
eukprot:364426-Chlamydomonas_euryale.AAC.35